MIRNPYAMKTNHYTGVSTQKLAVLLPLSVLAPYESESVLPMSFLWFTLTESALAVGLSKNLTRVMPKNDIWNKIQLVHKMCQIGSIMIDHNYARSQDQPFPPEWIHAVCVASDTPIISASAWNDIKPETAFITDTDYQIEHFEFNVIKDLNRIFLAGTSELLDEVSEFVKGFSDSHQDGFSGHGGIKGDGFFAKRATLASKVSDLVKAHIPPEEKMDSLQRIYRRLIVSSLMPDVWEPQKRPGDKKSLNDVPFSMWKHQIDRINDVFIAIAEKNERGSSPEVLSDCFRAMVGIEPQIIHSDFQRKLTDSVVCMPCETSSSTGFASKNDNTKSALTCDSGAHVAESGENEVSNIQVDWDDIEPLSVHDAIPVYGDVWATVLQLTELEQSEKILKIGSEISYYFVHFFNSEASFKSFELPHFELSSPLADHEGLLLLSEMCLDSAKNQKDITTTQSTALASCGWNAPSMLLRCFVDIST